MIDPDDKDFTVGVVGAGAMGQGIAQVSLMGGMNVILFDARADAAEDGLDAVFKRLYRLAEKGRLNSKDVQEMRGRAIAASSLKDFGACHLVIEAVFEDLDVKRKVFADIEEAVSEECVIVSNTSSLLISAIARNAQHKARIAGMHFFNPVPVMPLVEVIRGAETSGETVEFLVAAGTRMGRTPVVASDRPGFIVNLGGRAFTTEGARLMHEQVATPAQIDAIMRDCCHFRLGPLELMDLTGVDVNYPVSQIIYNGYDQDPRLKTSFPHRALMEAGRLGRKTRHGNYAYDVDGNKVEPPSADLETDAAPAGGVVLIDPDDDLIGFAASIGLKTLDKDDGKSPLLAAPLGEDCASIAARTGADHRRLVAIDLACDTSTRVTVMTAPGADLAIRDALAATIIASGRAVTAIHDSPGFVSQRIRAMIANLGCEMAQIGVAAPDEIDKAMRLGLNYPLGPLELAADIGLERVNAILVRVQAITGDDRYRPSQWLRRRALLGLDVATPD